jgi:hypothetical protein
MPEANERRGRSRIHVVPAGEEHAEVVAAFFRAVWDPHATADSVRKAWRADAIGNPGALGKVAPTFLVLLDGRVVGFVSSIPFMLWSGGVERPAAYWIKGLMVLPEYRNGPIGFMMLKEAVQHLPCATSLTVALPSRRLFEALGFQNLGRLRNYVRLLRPSRVFRRLDFDALALPGLPAWVPAAARMAQRSGVATVLGSGAAVALRALSLPSRLRHRGLSVASADIPPPTGDLDGLWRRVRERLRVGGVRDGRYLAWRYHGSRAGVYRFVTVQEAGTLAGVAVIRRPSAAGDARLRGLRVAVLADMLFPVERGAIGDALVAGAEAVSHRLDADALLVSLSHSALEAILRRRFYVPVPGTMYFLMRDPAGTFALPGTLSEWWLTRGDMEADEVF